MTLIVNMQPLHMILPWHFTDSMWTMHTKYSTAAEAAAASAAAAG